MPYVALFATHGMGDGGYEGGGGDSGGGGGDTDCAAQLDECLGSNFPAELCEEEFLACQEGF